MLRYIANSIIVAGAATCITITIGSLAAYAFARFQLTWTNVYLLLLLADFHVSADRHRRPGLESSRPLAVGSIPITAWWRPMSLFRLPLATWILTTFFREVPREIEEAALIDGCSRLQALYKIVLPLAAPGIFTAALLVFIYAWNEFFFALDHLDRSRCSNPARGHRAVPR